MIMRKRRGGLIAGLLIGAGLGVLFAPKKGSETRAELKEKCNELYEKLKEVEFSDIKVNIENKLSDLQQELKNLDGEKIGAVCRSQARKIKAKAEELYELAVQKSSPVLQKAADDVRQKAAELLHNAADKIDAPEEIEKPKQKKKSRKPSTKKV